MLNRMCLCIVLVPKTMRSPGRYDNLSTTLGVNDQISGDVQVGVEAELAVLGQLDDLDPLGVLVQPAAELLDLELEVEQAPEDELELG